MGRIIAIVLPIVIIAAAVTISTSTRLQSANAKIASLETQLEQLQADNAQQKEAATTAAEALAAARETAAKSAAEQADRLAALEAQLAAADRKIAAQAAESDWEDDGAKATVTEAPKKDKPKGFGAILEGMMKDENMQKMMRRQQRAMLDNMYGALFKRLNLPEDKLNALKDLLVERQMSGAERGMSLFSAGQDKEKMAALVEELKLEREAVDQEIAGLLSPDEFDAFKSYEDTMGERMAVSQFANRLQAVGEPLSPEQNDQLIQLMHENNRQELGVGYSNNNPEAALEAMQSAEGIEEMLAKMDRANESLSEQSGAILSPSQHKIFVEHQKQQAQMQKVGIQMMKAMMANDSDKN